jgi:hypothetical protein
VGKVYTAPDGSTYRPSMLDSCGPVPGDGTLVNPDRYDYRRAASDAVHLLRLRDRFWQNLRRCEGWNVQCDQLTETQSLGKGEPSLLKSALLAYWVSLATCGYG